MELDQPETIFALSAVGRARIPEPPPVRLITIDDAHLPAASGIECDLDLFYMGILRFEREPGCEYPIYRSENFRVVFDVLEPPITRDTLRPLCIEVSSLGEIEQKLLDNQSNYVRQRGLMPGEESLILRDPAGNWVQIEQRSELR